MWKLRAFRAALVDAIFATILLVPAWFFAPHIVDKVAAIVGIWQPVFVLYIVGPQLEASARKALDKLL